MLKLRKKIQEEIINILSYTNNLINFDNKKYWIKERKKIYYPLSWQIERTISIFETNEKEKLQIIEYEINKIIKVKFNNWEIYESYNI